VQSRREPDGVGLGVFEPDGTAQVHKRPIAAYQDAEFAREAREVSSSTFLAHVRYASTGDHASICRSTVCPRQGANLRSHVAAGRAPASTPRLPPENAREVSITSDKH
jgi:hypothetical protein